MLVNGSLELIILKKMFKKGLEESGGRGTVLKQRVR